MEKSILIIIIAVFSGLSFLFLNSQIVSINDNIRYMDKDIDNLTKYMNDNKNAMLDYFNLEVERLPIRFKKKGK